MIHWQLRVRATAAAQSQFWMAIFLAVVGENGNSVHATWQASPNAAGQDFTLQRQTSRYTLGCICCIRECVLWLLASFTVFIRYGYGHDFKGEGRCLLFRQCQNSLNSQKEALPREYTKWHLRLVPVKRTENARIGHALSWSWRLCTASRTLLVCALITRRFSVDSV